MRCAPPIQHWPPIWAQAAQDGGNKIDGEVGILKYALTVRRLNNKCFLIIEHENERYSATLSFNDAEFFLHVYHLLKNRVGRPIKEIGDLDLSYTLRHASRHGSSIDPRVPAHRPNPGKV